MAAAAVCAETFFAFDALGGFYASRGGLGAWRGGWRCAVGVRGFGACFLIARGGYCFWILFALLGCCQEAGAQAEGAECGEDCAGVHCWLPVRPSGTRKR